MTAWLKFIVLGIFLSSLTCNVYASTYTYNEHFTSALDSSWEIVAGSEVGSHNLAVDSSYLRVTSLNRSGSEQYVYLYANKDLPHGLESFSCSIRFSWDEYAANTGFGLLMYLRSDDGNYVGGGLQDWWYVSTNNPPPNMYGLISDGIRDSYHNTTTGSENGTAVLTITRDETGYLSVYWNGTKLLAYSNTLDSEIDYIQFAFRNMYRNSTNVNISPFGYLGVDYINIEGTYTEAIPEPMSIMTLMIAVCAMIRRKLK